MFQDNLGKSVPECLHSEFYDGDGNNWSYKKCKAPVKVSPPTNKQPTFYGTIGKVSHSTELLIPS